MEPRLAGLDWSFVPVTLKNKKEMFSTPNVQAHSLRLLESANFSLLSRFGFSGPPQSIYFFQFQPSQQYARAQPAIASNIVIIKTFWTGIWALCAYWMVLASTIAALVYLDVSPGAQAPYKPYCTIAYVLIKWCWADRARYFCDECRPRVFLH